MSGSTVGGVLGAVVGSFIPGVGTSLGWMIGSTVGGIVDPQKIQGPRLTDAQRQTSQEGVPIPFGYGTFPCMGNVIWADVLVEHKHKESGKGGPQTITYTYTRSFAIGFCEGPYPDGISGYQQVKINGKLVYDISPTSTILSQNAKFLEGVTLYYGSETQTVDPTIEAVVGVGNVPPMRGLAYLVFTDYDCTDTQGAIPQVEVVVQMCGTTTTTPAAPDLLSIGSQVGHGNAYDVALGRDGGTFTDVATDLPSTVTIQAAGMLGSAAIAGALSGTVYSASAPYTNWNAHATGLAGIDCMSIGGGAIVCGYGTTIAYSTDAAGSWNTTSFPAGSINAAAYGDSRHAVVGYDSSGIGPTFSYCSDPGSWTHVPISSGSTFTPFSVCWTGAYWVVSTNNFEVWRSPDRTTWAKVLDAGMMGGNNPTLIASDGLGTVVLIDHDGSGHPVVLMSTEHGANLTDVTAAYASTAAVFGLSYTQGKFRTLSRSSADGAAWAVANHGGASGWDQMRSVFVAVPTTYLPAPDAPGVYVDADGNVIDDYVESSSLSDCGTSLDEILYDLCIRSGIDPAEIDPTLPTDTLAGFRCAASNGSAEGYVEALRVGYFFDRGEWDKQIRFPSRGSASVASLTTDDLVRLDEDKPCIQQTQIQEAELLRKVNVLTLDPAAGYAMGKQTWERRIATIQAKGEESIEIPVVCSADDAAQMAEKRGKVAWAEGDKFRYGLPPKWSKLTPTDNIELTDKRGVTHTVRLQDMNELAGLITVEEAVRTRLSVYTDAVATGSSNGNTGGSSSPGIIGPTLLAAMNLPQLRSQDGSGLYIGMAGMTDGWSGAQLLISYDGGVSYTPALTVTSATIMGDLTDPITASGEPLSVHVFGGQLASATAAQVTAGINASAVISAGVAEILSYETATDFGDGYYDLTDLTRGQKYTAPASHAIGDQFVDLNTAYFVPIDTAYAGQTLYLKAVGNGVSADAVTPVTIVYDPNTYSFSYRIDGNGDFRIDGNGDHRVTRNEP